MASTTTITPPNGPPFDDAACSAIEKEITSGRPDAALQELAKYAPADDAQRARAELLTGMAVAQQGEFIRARLHCVRALRFAHRRVDLRPSIRGQLAHALIRLGDLERAERQLRIALAEIGDPRLSFYPACRALNEMGILHRRRGRLSEAIRCYEEMLALIRMLDDADGAPRALLVASTNLALALTHRGHLEEADRLLRELEERHGAFSGDWRVSAIHLARARHAMNAGNTGAWESALVRAAACVLGPGSRNAVILREYSALLQIERGSAEEALPVLRELMDQVCRQAPSGDLVAEIARCQAMALSSLGRHEEALERARLAVSIGRTSDILEGAMGLRIAAECLGALGRRDEARAVLEEAWQVIGPTEFAAERRRVERLLSSADGRNGAATGATARITSRRPAAGEPVRLPLRDGRTLVTNLHDLAARIAAAATSELPVIIEGETGTGKELIANLLHELSRPPRAPFVVVDCGALHEGLANAELFGVTKGAFTGASTDRRGLVAAADGGTLFLDELADLPLTTQAMLLRVLQEGTYRRVGEDRQRRVSARIVVATNRSPESLIAGGRLRPDLFFRLNGFRLPVPPLRERPSDIDVLAHEFARSAGMAGVTTAAAARLRAHGWPGNTRELEMVVRRAVSRLERGGWLTEDVLDHLRGDGPVGFTPTTSLDAHRREAERRALQRALEQHGGNVSAAARTLGMSRQGLYKALRRVDLR